MSKAIPHFDNVAPEMSDSMEFTAAMLTLRAKARAYWHFAVKHKLIWTYAIPTGATDGVYIYINPDYFFGLPSHGQRAFLLGHEVAHIVLKHGWRGLAFRKIGYFRVLNGVNIPFIHRLWNWVTDAIINADLIAHGLEPIEGAILDDRFDRDFVADDAYLEKFKEWEQEQEDEPADDESEASGNGEPSEAMGNPMPADGDDGDADDGDADDGDADGDVDGDAVDGDAVGETDGEVVGEADGDADGDVDGEPDADADGGGAAGSDHDGHDTHLEPKYDGTAEEVEEAEREDERALDKATTDGAKQQEQAIKDGEHKDVGVGDGVAGRLKSAEERKSAPMTWSDELADLLQRSGKGSETSYAKIHRRRFNLYGVVSPVTRGALNQIGFVVDVSYSVDRNALRECMHVLADVIDQLQPSGGAIVVFCGDEYVDHAEVFSGSELLDLEIPYGGGTYMSAGIDWLEQNGYDPDVTLVFTDAEMYDEDMQKVVDSGAVIVLDGAPSWYARRVIERAQARVITVADDSLAA